jgi:hypothetical protein
VDNIIKNASGECECCGKKTKRLVMDVDRFMVCRVCINTCSECGEVAGHEFGCTKHPAHIDMIGFYADLAKGEGLWA